MTRRETQADKLAALLGINKEVAETAKPQPPRSKHVEGMDGPEVGHYRTAEAVVLFFQAPKLFSVLDCKNCGKPFAVSRKHVRHCSKDCLQEMLRADGLHLDESYGSAEYISRVWLGNEPLTIPPEVLETISEMLKEHSQLVGSSQE